jgi:hypothetical protein
MLRSFKQCDPLEIVSLIVLNDRLIDIQTEIHFGDTHTGQNFKDRSAKRLKRKRDELDEKQIKDKRSKDD